MKKKKKKINKKEASLKLKKAFKFYLENGGNLSRAMKDAGYAPAVAKNPHKLRETKGWQLLMQEHLPDKTLAEHHKKLLNSKRIEHMVFPCATKDKEIKELLESVGCTVRKIQHGEMAIHVWFWAADNRALKDGLDMAYKLKSKYAAQKLTWEDPIESIPDDDIEDELKRRQLEGASEDIDD